MINALTLRLNNWLQEGTQACRVVLLAEDSVTVEYANGIDDAKLSPDQLEGLPLTIELLKHAGFLPTGIDHEHQLLLEENIVITVNRHMQGGYSVQLCLQDHWCGKPVQYLHELQNIYMDLTGEVMKLDYFD